MLKMILMTQIYFTDGSYYFQNFNVIVHDERECKVMAESIINTALNSLSDKKRSYIRQTGFSCTDKIEVEYLWAIPTRIPIP